MRFKILLIVFLALVFVCFVGMASVMRTQTVQITQLRERVQNLEIIVHQEVISEKIPAKQESTKRHGHPEIAI
ncbi:MAG: hypothetical protein ACYSUV_12785 [Planctomycetota bacterium]|jgi:hypothetical protein